MTSRKNINNFIDLETQTQTRRSLELMVLDDSYNTEPSYSANTKLYPDNLMPFVDKHINYLRSHPAINPRLYISNLQLMTRIRSSAYYVAKQIS